MQHGPYYNAEHLATYSQSQGSFTHCQRWFVHFYLFIGHELLNADQQMYIKRELTPLQNSPLHKIVHTLHYVTLLCRPSKA